MDRTQRVDQQLPWWRGQPYFALLCLCPCLLLVFILLILFPGWQGKPSYCLCLCLCLLSFHCSHLFPCLWLFLVYKCVLFRFFLQRTTGLLQLSVFYNPPLLFGKRALLSKVTIITIINITRELDGQQNPHHYPHQHHQNHHWNHQNIRQMDRRLGENQHSNQHEQNW